MKTQSQWLQMLAKCGSDHPAACCCDRCKHGVETFLLESDIADIQRDARDGMVEANDVKPMVDAICWVAEHRPGGVIESALIALRAKHPNLFTK